MPKVPVRKRLKAVKRIRKSKKSLNLSSSPSTRDPSSTASQILGVEVTQNELKETLLKSQSVPESPLCARETPASELSKVMTSSPESGCHNVSNISLSEISSCAVSVQMQSSPASSLGDGEVLHHENQSRLQISTGLSPQPLGDVTLELNSPDNTSGAKPLCDDCFPAPNAASTPFKDTSRQHERFAHLSVTEARSHLEDLLNIAKEKIGLFLHKSWISQVCDGGIHVMQLSRKFEKAVQRRIFFSADGEIKLSVHCVPLSVDKYLNKVRDRVSLNCETIGPFVDRCVEVVNVIRRYEICAGISEEEFKNVWQFIPSGRIDSNPYQENRYSETFRSVKCDLLVPPQSWHCKNCEKLRRPLHRRSAAHCKEAHPFTPNSALSDEQKKQKLQNQQKKVNACNRRLDRMREKMKKIIVTEGVQVSDDIAEDLTDILKEYDLSPSQTLFMQQQLQASQAKGPSGVRWHPSMIRFALALHLASPSCYQLARDSGMIKLPSQRTLFDYSHATEAKEGVDDVVLEDVSKEVESLPEPYQKYHVLMCDEMHISQNLVYRKSTGEMLGYVKLNEALADLAALENYLGSGDSSVKPQIATKMLSFLIKGIASSVKEVVASYSVNKLTTEFLYSTTWEVINRCEMSGIAIIGFVSDGYSVNRSFIKKHNPVNVTPSGLIYSTINKSAPHRLVFFLSDVAHLLKTIRNCLLNSRRGKKAKRCLQKGGEKMLWQYIVSLYKMHRDDNLRKSYKLTSQHVYIDSYSAMKVKFAAQVLSKTVAKDLEDMKWSGTAEMVKFIRNVNDWFDCLNGAFFNHGKKTKNSNLDPYTSPDDPRFEKMKGFLQYLSDWKEEVYSVNALAADMSMSTQIPEEVSFSSVQEEERVDEAGAEAEEITTTPAKQLLSAQTMDGIEFTTLAFIDATKFLLEKNTKKVNARVFSQDHIEQRFSRQRDKGGPSSNPNYAKYLLNNVSLHLQGQLGVKKRKGNTEDTSRGMIITEEPLPKRKKSKATKPQL